MAETTSQVRTRVGSKEMLVRKRSLGQPVKYSDIMRNSKCKNLKNRFPSFAGDRKSEQIFSPLSFTAADCTGVKSSIADVIEQSQSALSVAQLAGILKTSDQTLYRMISDHTIPFFTIRGSYRFDPRATASWLRKRCVNF